MSNNSDVLLFNGSCLELQWSVRAGLVATILGTITSLTIFGNVLVLMAVALNRNLRNTTTIFVANLAVADLLLGTSVLPFSSFLEVTNGCWIFGTVFCEIWAAVDVLCCTASIFSLCVISMDRYLGVTKPLQHSRILTRTRAVFIVLGIWVVSFLVSVGPLIGWQKPETSPNPFECGVASNIEYILFSVLFSFYLPLCIIIFFYIRIYKAAVEQTKFLESGIKTTKMKSSENGSCGSSKSLVTLRVHRGGYAPAGQTALQTKSSPQMFQPKMSRKNLQLAAIINRKTNAISNVPLTYEHGKLARFKREKKAAKTLGIVVGVFIMCWLPFFFLYPFGSLCEVCRIPKLVFKVVFWLGYCNSLCNPIIYACWNREFQRAFIRILRCRLTRTCLRSNEQINDNSHTPQPLMTTEVVYQHDWSPRYHSNGGDSSPVLFCNNNN